MTDAVLAPALGARSTSAAFSTTDWAVFGGIGAIWGASFLFIAIGLGVAVRDDHVELPALVGVVLVVTGRNGRMLADASVG